MHHAGAADRLPVQLIRPERPAAWIRPDRHPVTLQERDTPFSKPAPAADGNTWPPAAPPNHNGNAE